MNRESLLARAFADQCRRWARNLDAPEAAIRMAGQAGYLLEEAMAEGKVSLPLRAAEGLEAAMLLASRVVGAPESNAPIVLADGMLSLRRYFDARTRLFHALATLNTRPPSPPGPQARAMLHTLFPREAPGNAPPLEDLFAAPDAVDGQKQAVALALLRRFVLVSGGPGTGKTTTVARLLACLIAEDPACRVALAAPTGKAAARLQEALAAQGRALPEAIAAKLPRAASTLHRLLGIGVEGRARHGRENPLPIDVLVIDEASMLDLLLALQTVEALPATARLILLGDRDQLEAVEAGAVFASLTRSAALSAPLRRSLAELMDCPAEALARPPYTETSASGELADCVARLTTRYRFTADSPLGKLAAAIRMGDAKRALAAFSTGNAKAAGESLVFLDSGRAGALLPAERECLHAGYAPYGAALEAWRHTHDPAPVFAAFERFRALCVVRQGERGVEGVNRRLAEFFREAARQRGEFLAPSGIFHGLALMILRNDPALNLANGEIGIALSCGRQFSPLEGSMPVEGEKLSPSSSPLPGRGKRRPQDTNTGREAPDVPPGEYAVWFRTGNGFRVLPPVRLPAWEMAYALTVHKAQGSEFQEVALLLPEHETPLLTRRLLYTAITRARQSAAILGDARHFCDGLQRGDDG
jgi:exodeoxyribonuclease V alpha subunit